MLIDSNQEVIKMCNLQFNPEDDYHKRRDLYVLNGDGSIKLLVPATFIIDICFTIMAALIEAN